MVKTFKRFFPFLFAAFSILSLSIYDKAKSNIINENHASTSLSNKKEVKNPNNNKDLNKNIGVAYDGDGTKLLNPTEDYDKYRSNVLKYGNTKHYVTKKFEYETHTKIVKRYNESFPLNTKFRPMRFAPHMERNPNYKPWRHNSFWELMYAATSKKQAEKDWAYHHVRSLVIDQASLQLRLATKSTIKGGRDYFLLRNPTFYPLTTSRTNGYWMGDDKIYWKTSYEPNKTIGYSDWESLSLYAIETYREKLSTSKIDILIEKFKTKIDLQRNNYKEINLKKIELSGFITRWSKSKYRVKPDMYGLTSSANLVFETVQTSSKTKQENVDFQKIYLDHQFVNKISQKSDDLRKLIKVRDKNITEYFVKDLKMINDNGKWKLTFNYKNVDRPVVGYVGRWNPVSIDVSLYNIDNLIKISKLSNGYQKHTRTGELLYWFRDEYTRGSSKIGTKLKFNESWFKFLWYKKTKELVKEKFFKDINNIKKEHKIEIEKLIVMNAINIDNYQKAKERYMNSRNINTIKNLQEIKIPIDYSYNDKISIDEYIYIIKNSSFKVRWGTKLQHAKTLKYREIGEPNGEIFKINITEFSSNPGNIAWTNRISLEISHNDNLIFSESDKNYEKNILTINESNELLLKTYGLNFNYELNSNKLIVKHNFLLQYEKINVSKAVSFILEDGTILDYNFIILKSQDSSKIGKKGYILTRYFVKGNSQNGEKYYTIEQDNKKEWIASSTKQKIKTLDKTFEPKKIEFVFDKKIHMVIDPFKQTFINEKGEKALKFGISKVSNVKNGNPIVLEDWNDGRWDHVLNTDGTPRKGFDGVFGASNDGHLDSRGLLSHGKNEVYIQLTKTNVENLNNSFTIVVDEEPVKIKVQPGKETGTRVVKSEIQVKDKWYDLYSSNAPIKFTVHEIDIRNNGVVAEIIDSKGDWYKYDNIDIKTKEIDGAWVLEIDSTYTFAGLARITVFDQANNFKTIYLLLKNNSYSPKPEMLLNEKNKIKIDKPTYKGKNIAIVKNNSDVIFFDSLIKNFEIEEVEAKTNLYDSDKGYKIEDYVYNDESIQKYSTARSIDDDNQSTKLKFSGDKLKENLEKTGAEKWEVTKKKITFNKVGSLYKIKIFSILKEDNYEEWYLYVNDPNKNNYIFKNERYLSHNFKKIKEKEKSFIDDNVYFSSSEIIANFFDFELKEYEAKYSQFWSNEFKTIDTKDLKREGKYVIRFKRHGTNNSEVWTEREFLVLNKKLTTTNRLIRGEIPIVNTYKPTYERQKYPFWKGEMVWDGYRYHDKDHLEWLIQRIKEETKNTGLSTADIDRIIDELLKNGWDGNNKTIGNNKWIKDKFTDGLTSLGLDQKTINKIKEYWAKNKVKVIDDNDKWIKELGIDEETIAWIKNYFTKNKTIDFEKEKTFWRKFISVVDEKNNKEEVKTSSYSMTGVIVGSVLASMSLILIIFIFYKKSKIKKWKK